MDQSNVYEYETSDLDLGALLAQDQDAPLTATTTKTTKTARRDRSSHSSDDRKKKRRVDNTSSRKSGTDSESSSSSETSSLNGMSDEDFGNERHSGQTYEDSQLKQNFKGLDLDFLAEDEKTNTMTLDQRKRTTWESLSPGTKMLARANHVGVRTELAENFFNCLNQLQSTGVNPSLLINAANLFGYIEINKRHLDELKQFNGVLPDMWDLTATADARLDHIFLTSSNFISVMLGLQKYVVKFTLSHDSRKASIKFKDAKAATLDFALNDGKNACTSMFPPISPDSIDALKEVFTNMHIFSSLPLVDRLHEYVGLFPKVPPSQNIRKEKTEVQISRLTIPPFNYKETQLNSVFVRAVTADNVQQPVLPHSRCFDQFRRLLSQSKAKTFFVNTAQDMFAGSLFIPLKLKEIFESQNTAAQKATKKLCSDFRKIIYSSSAHIMPQFRLDRSVTDAIGKEIEQVLKLLPIHHAPSQRDFAMCLGDLLKGAEYATRIFKFQWGKYTHCMTTAPQKPLDAEESRSQMIKRLTAVVATRQKFVELITGTVSIPLQLFRIIQYFNAFAKIVKQQDIITPMGEQIALHDQSMIKQKVRSSIKDVIEFHRQDNKKREHYNKTLTTGQPTQVLTKLIIVAEKKIFASHLDGSSPFDFADADYMLLTSKKADHANNVYSHKTPESLKVQLDKYCSTASRSNKSAVVVLATVGLPIDVVHDCLYRSNVKGIKDFTVITDLQGLGTQQKPLIHFLPNEHDRFPSFTNSEIVGNLIDSHRPVVAFSLRQRNDEFDLAQDHHKNRTVVTNNLKQNYFKLLIPVSQMLCRLIDSVGNNAGSTNPQYLVPSEVLEMLDDTFSKSIIEDEEDMNAQVSRTFASDVAEDADMLNLMVGSNY